MSTVQNLQTFYQYAFTKKKIAVPDLTWQCCLDTGEDYYLSVREERLEFSLGRHATPTLTLYFNNADTPLQIAEGRVNPMDAFLQGHFRADSHLLLVMLYLMLFGLLSTQADLQ